MAENKDIEYYFLRKKPVKILTSLNNGKQKLNYASQIAKDVSCTYSHTVNILQKLNENNLIEYEKKGRLKLINLTEEGEKLAKRFSKVRSIFSKTKNS